MKKQFFNTANIKVYTSALLVSFFLLTGFNNAQASGKDYMPAEAKITCVASESNLITFNVDYKNNEETPFVLELTDDSGLLLYKQKFTEKTFNKNILLKNMGEMVKVNFSIRSGKKVINQTFNITTETKLVENVLVTKI